VIKRVCAGGLGAVLVLLGTSASASAATNPVNVASKAGIYEFTRTFSVNPGDYNKDWSGKYPDDFFFVRHNPDLGKDNLPPSTLWRNQPGGTYVNSGVLTGRTDKHGCDWGDYNEDALPDLACAIGFGQNSKNELWRQNANGTFTNVAGTLGLNNNTHGRYRYVTFIDANNDGNLDLYFARYYGPSVAWDPTSPSYYPGDTFPNELWINRGPGAATPYSFRSAPEYGLNVLDGARKDAAACAQAIDYDNDGDQDLLVCGETALKLYRNNFPTATFTAVTTSMGADFPRVHDAIIKDLDRDGIKELVRLGATTLKVSTRSSNSAPWSSTPYSFSLASGESLAAGDFNGDKLYELFVVSRRRVDPDYLVVQKLDLAFNRISVGTTLGSGDDVGVVDYNRDGDADFVVSNGNQKNPGPVQLWTNQAAP
jgi:FG-GAP-like repeat